MARTRTQGIGFWYNDSSYSRGETDRTPKTWSMRLGRLGELTLCVTRHIHYPGKWVIRFDPFVSLMELKSADVEEAKAEALQIARDYLTGCVESLPKGKGETE